jgi:hypothetical protein
MLSGAVNQIDSGVSMQGEPVLNLPGTVDRTIAQGVASVRARQLPRGE